MCSVCKQILPMLLRKVIRIWVSDAAADLSEQSSLGDATPVTQNADWLGQCSHGYAKWLVHYYSAAIRALPLCLSYAPNTGTKLPCAIYVREQLFFKESTLRSFPSWLQTLEWWQGKVLHKKMNSQMRLKNLKAFSANIRCFFFSKKKKSDPNTGIVSTSQTSQN